MGKKTKPFITQIQAEGTKTERDLEKKETLAEVKELASQLPVGPDRVTFVRNLVFRALRGEVDLEVFKLFCKLTNSWLEVETVLPRAKLLTRSNKEV